MKVKILYVFSGEQASGAEIVIETLMSKNMATVAPHLFISPGRFSDKLVALEKPYVIKIMPQLRKLNRSKTSIAAFALKALKNYIIIPLVAVRYLYRHNISIVHANTVVPASYLIPAVIFTKIFRPQTMWIWSDHDLKYFKKSDHYFSKICCRLYHKTLVVSNAVKARYGNSKNVEVLYNGLDTALYVPNVQRRQNFRKQWEISNDTIVFAIAGILSPRKRQLELMKAFSKVSKNNLNVELFLAGDFGPDAPGYNQEVKELLAQQQNIKYIGHVDNMVGFYNGCDVIVNNSSAAGSEPFGATMYEAMSCQTIVMAAHTGGLPEIIDHKVSGFLFEPDNEIALANMMEYVIKHFQNLEEIKKTARKKVIEKFDHEIIRNQYNRLLGLSPQLV